jgi:UDP-N-acetylmuramoylalanine-D-glutamate ligase
MRVAVVGSGKVGRAVVEFLTATGDYRVTAVDTSAGPVFWTERSTSTLSPGTYAIGLSAPASSGAWAMASNSGRNRCGR